MVMTTSLRILLADDHPLFRSGLRALLASDPRLNVVAEAENGEVALAEIQKHRPDVAVLDLEMPIKGGFEVVSEIQQKKIPVEVIVLTAYKSEEMLTKALDLGIKGFVLKDSAVAEILDCIAMVMKGKNYISPELSSFLVGRRDRADSLAREIPGLAHLTPTERRILKGVAQEKITKEIADELSISVRTVDHHRANICLKLDLHGTNALFKFAVSHRSELL